MCHVFDNCTADCNLHTHTERHTLRNSQVACCQGQVPNSSVFRYALPCCFSCGNICFDPFNGSLQETIALPFFQLLLSQEALIPGRPAPRHLRIRETFLFHSGARRRSNVFVGACVPSGRVCPWDQWHTPFPERIVLQGPLTC